MFSTGVKTCKNNVVVLACFITTNFYVDRSRIIGKFLDGKFNGKVDGKFATDICSKSMVNLPSTEFLLLLRFSANSSAAFDYF